MAKFEIQAPPCQDCSHNCGGNRNYCDAYRLNNSGGCPDLEMVARDKGFVKSLSVYNWLFITNRHTFRGAYLSRRQADQAESIIKQYKSRPSIRGKTEDAVDWVRKGDIVKYWDKSGRLSIGEVDLVNVPEFHIRIMNSGTRGGHTINMSVDKYEVVNGGNRR